MTQTTILSPGTTAAASTAITVGAGESVTVGIYTTAGRLPANVGFTVTQTTPGGGNVIARLTNADRATVLAAPGTYEVQRPAYTGDAFGAFTDDGA